MSVHFAPPNTPTGFVEVITVPEWTDATDWAACADPAVMPGIMLGERFGLLPQIFVAGSAAPAAIAVSLGGILSGFRAFRKLAEAYWILVSVAIAWKQVGMILLLLLIAVVVFNDFMRLR